MYVHSRLWSDLWAYGHADGDGVGNVGIVEQNREDTITYGNSR
jgi:hypothetical protein